MIQFSKLLPYLHEAGQLALSYYQTELDRERKADFSPVTAADKAVEAFLIEKIQTLYQANDYEIIGEESGGQHEGKAFAWAIDPIDGTRVFIDGLSTWAISVGLLKEGEGWRGAVYLPVLRELYYTSDEGEAFWSTPYQKQPQHLTEMLPTEWHRDSFIGVPSAVHRYFNIDFRRLRSFGAIATHHVYVARGASIAAFHRRAALWDIAGAHAILTAAGGEARYLDGQVVSLRDILLTGKARAPMLAGHPQVVAQLLDKFVRV